MAVADDTRGQQKQRKRQPSQPAGYPQGVHITLKGAVCHCGGCSTTWPLEAKDA